MSESQITSGGGTQERCAPRKDTSDYKHLGTANGWREDPEEVIQCRATKGCYPQAIQRHGRCFHRYACHRYKVTWDVDSSD